MFYRKAETAAKVILDVFQSGSMPQEPKPDFIYLRDIPTPALHKWLKTLPLRDVAQTWGISVGCFKGRWSFKGYYTPSNAIGLGVYNLATWAHELIHAADDRKGTLTQSNQLEHDNEIVAEFGGAILLGILDKSVESDLGGCWNYTRDHAIQISLTPIAACQQFLKRTCDCVALILETAERI